MLHGSVSQVLGITICSLFFLHPHLAQLKALTGRWSIAGPPSSEHFRSPALGADIEIVVTDATIVLDYSYNRHKTLRLDGTELKSQFLVADGGQFEDIASARVQDGRVIITTSRQRGGIVSREERVLAIVGEELVVDARRWVGGKLLETSKLAYRRK